MQMHGVRAQFDAICTRIYCDTLYDVNYRLCSDIYLTEYLFKPSVTVLILKLYRKSEFANGVLSHINTTQVLQAPYGKYNVHM